ncbi:MAG: methionine--tRNA ligase [Clostridia bacterium]|nr:methionine--tRNA ligase [Clostridia bacterium]
MSEKRYYVTTPIYYASGDLHVGHCFSTVFADACARFKRLDGYDVLFLTGSDEHGMKIAKKAAEAGLTPQAFVDKTVAGFKNIWKILGISYDKFIRTTDEEHIACVNKIMQKLYDNGDIYLDKYEGLYCVPCETFFTEGQLVNGNCPDCGRSVEKASEPCYFFRMSKYTDYLKQLFKDNPNFLVPESRKNEIYTNFIKDGVQDLCVTRTSFDWGIKAPFDPKHVVYVWCDALVNYISALGYGSKDESLFEKFWPCDVHIIGRDISRFHAIIWPIILRAAGIEPPKQIHSTGFITLKGDKISKSKSNGFDPVALCNKYGADALRYYMLKEGPIYNDIPFAFDVFLKTINSDLCNDLGNLVSRTIAMITQNFGAVVPQPNEFNDDDKVLIDMINSLYTNCVTALNEQRVDMAMKDIFDCVRYANKYIDITEPWVLAKKEETKGRLATVLYTLAETIRVCTVLLQAFLVEIPNKIFDKFETPANLRTFDSIKAFNANNYGHSVEKGEAIFPRLDIEKELEYLNLESTTSKKVEKVEEKVEEELITIDEFDKVKLAVGTIVNSEKVEKADKLLKNTVLINGVERTIVSGIAKHYSPEDVIGKQVVVVTNLKPVKLRGILSEGMILCAVDGEELSLVSPIKNMKDGSQVC